MKHCRHVGPYRAIQASRGDAWGDCAIVCMGCGAFQRTVGGTLRENVCEMMRGRPSITDPWYGTVVPLAAYSDGTALRLLSSPLADLIEAHRAALRGERVEAERRMDSGWFINHFERAPWLEYRHEETSGDLLYRPRAGWKPPSSSYDPGPVHGDLGILETTR